MQADRFDLFAEGVTIVTCIDDETARRLNIFAGVMKAPARPGGQAAFDLDNPRRCLARNFQHQVDFCTGGGAIKTRLCPF